MEWNECFGASAREPCLPGRTYRSTSGGLAWTGWRSSPFMNAYDELYSLEKLTRFAMRWGMRNKLIVFALGSVAAIAWSLRLMPAKPEARAEISPTIITQYVRIVETQFMARKEEPINWEAPMWLTNLNVYSSITNVWTGTNLTIANVCNITNYWSGIQLTNLLR